MLNTNNNQNFISYPSLDLQQKLQDRRVFEQFLNKTNRITCDKPKGHLVKENPLQMFGSTFTDTAKDVKNLGSALVTGKSNDHELGRMNDLGMKVGGGLIAAALMGSKTTTSKKLMELFGFGTFFTVMSLWPKVAIDLPTKLIHGFNPHQKYIDSQGRKKQFFQDNQYLPWDVWSKEDINKVADKMNVPEDLKDREEYTKEKMRTTALQDNTLWMLTAGFATPLLTSLICNRIEEGIRVPVANYNLRKVADEVSNMDSIVANTLSDTNLFKKQDDAVKGIVESLRNGIIPDNMAETLGEAFDLGRFAGQNSVKMETNGLRDAKDLLSKLLVNSNSYDEFAQALAGKEGENAVKEARELFEAAEKQAKSRGLDSSFESVLDFVRGIVRTDIDKYEGKQWVDVLFESTDSFPEELKTIAKGKGAYSKETLEKTADAIQDVYTTSVKPAQAGVKVLSDKVKILDGISGEKYNKTAAQMLKALGLSDKEIRVLRNSSTAQNDTLSNFISDRIAKIASDDSEYKKVIKKLDKITKSIETTTGKDKTKVSIKGVFETLTDKVSNIMQSSGEKIGNSADDALSGSLIRKTLENGLTEQERLAAGTNITSVDAMITKLKSALELERRINDGSLIKDWGRYAEYNKYTGDIQSMTKEELQNFYNLCRRALWQSTYGDAVNKFYTDGNGAFFKTLSDTIFAGAADNAENSDWLKRMKDMIQAENCIPYPALVKDKVPEMSDGIDEISRSHGIRFADYGESLLGTFKKQINQKYNDRSWMKVFGGMTVALLGVTFISQFFFGKVKDAHLYEKKDGNNR